MALQLLKEQLIQHYKARIYDILHYYAYNGDKSGIKKSKRRKLINESYRSK